MAKINYLFTFLLIISITPFIQAQELDHVLGDIIVQLPKHTTPDQVVKDLQVYNGVSTSLKIDKQISEPFNIWLLHFDQNVINENYFLHEISVHPGIEIAQFNHLLEERQSVPNDPSFSQQWQWLNSGQSGGTADADIDADEAWDITTGGLTMAGDEIVVCVMEGANRNHPDLQGNLWINAAEIAGNGIDDDNNGYIDDLEGWNAAGNNGNIPSANHGTAVSGMIGASGNNDVGISGINWRVKIMHVLVGNLTEANVVTAYTYPYVMRKRYNDTNGAEGAFIVSTNASWGIDGGQPADSPLWCNFYDSLGVEGVLNCGATANVGWDVDIQGDLPTACPSDFMVSVTATDDNDVRDFAAWGFTHVDVGAPGSNIYSLNTNGYSFTSGTSFASPTVAGLIALMYSAPCDFLGPAAIADPAGTALLIRDFMFNNVDSTAQLVAETARGGRVNAYKSIQAIMDNCGACPTPSSLEAYSIIDTSATLSWFNTDSAMVLDIRYRLLGDTVWTLVMDAPNPYDLTGLSGCQDYEFQVEAICADTMSEFSASTYFSTDGCCTAPSNVNLTATSDVSFDLSWNNVFAAQEYSVLFRPLGEAWTSFQTTNTSMSFENLELCTIYELQLETVCGPDSTSGYSDVITFETSCVCGIPENIDTVSVSMTNATIFWDAIDLAESYSLRYKVLGSVNWINLETADLMITVDSLQACSNYQYQVKSNCPITASNFSSTKLFFTACPVGIETIDGLSWLEVYPNPVQDEFIMDFDLKERKNVRIDLYTPSGQLVKTNVFNDINSGRNQLRINNLDKIPSGVYFIKITMNDQITLKRIIKQ